MAVEVSTKSRCGFCGDGNHDKCSIGTKHQGKHEHHKNGIVWACKCTEGGCEPGRRKCAKCGNKKTEEIDPTTWECADTTSCHDVVEAKRENNPFTAQLREIKERVKMAKIENTKEKAAKEKVEKEPTFCLVTGEPTSGGLFRPGQDAKYVSLRVGEVRDANFTKKAHDAAIKQMKGDGVSEKLIAKFEKSVGLAKEKAEKAAAAAKEKAAAKSE